MSKQYHIGRRGASAGLWVLCEATVEPCRNGTQHLSEETYLQLKKNLPIVPKNVEEIFALTDKKKEEVAQTVIAKVKTAYRETGVLFGISEEKTLDEILGMSATEYSELAIEKFDITRPGELSALRSLKWEAGHMPAEIADTLKANYDLGQKIEEYHVLTGKEIDPTTLKWVGDDTSKAPADITVNGELWSLKENSEIIKNSSAANLMNTVLGSQKYARNLHSLDAYAEKEHNEALIYAINKHNTANPSEPLPSVASFSEWSKHSKDTRKKLALFIRNSSVDKKSQFFKEFSELKQKANQAAGDNIINEMQTSDYANVKAGDLLSGNVSYYYAKTSSGKTSIGYIPSAEELNENVKLVNVTSRPGQQLDLMLTFENSRGEKLTIQSEMRYSHGQFAGTPESKMKIFSGNFPEFVAP